MVQHLFCCLPVGIFQHLVYLSVSHPLIYPDDRLADPVFDDMTFFIQVHQTA